jgi:hypothetical protein
MKNWSTPLAAMIAVVGLSLTFAAEARAACFAKGRTQAAALNAGMPFVQASASVPIDELSGAHHQSIVGLWKTTFLAGDGPDVLYEGFQQWHTGGTELMVDNGVPPAFGNVCVGVWKQIGSRTYRLRHVTFNWDEQGRSTGTFVMQMTVTLDRRGNRYTGKYVSDSFDLAGIVIPELHVEGVVRSVRITVE